MPVDFDTLRTRMVSGLLERRFDKDALLQLKAGVNAEGCWEDIDYEDLAVGAFDHSRHLARLQLLSSAFAAPGSPLYQDKDLLAVLHQVLDFWLERDFQAANWWHREIGVPDLMVSILLLLEEELTSNQRQEGARIVARAPQGGRQTDAIILWDINGRLAVFMRDAHLLEKAVRGMAGEIERRTGVGIQADLSHHHRSDRVLSILAYGYNTPRRFARWAAWTAGTGIDFPDDTVKLLIDYYLDGITRCMAFGRYRDPGAINRSLAIRSSLGPRTAEIPRTLLQVYTYRRDELAELVAVREGSIEPQWRRNTFFWRSEYGAHQRPAFFTSVRMFSSRNQNVEKAYTIEGYNRHHHADGANFMLRSGREYRDLAPVLDWQRIPGTTTVVHPGITPESMAFNSLEEVKGSMTHRGSMDFVGGVSDGIYGAVAFDFISPHDPLKARKAWFFFDDEWACLGAGIDSDAEHPVNTTINQCRLRGVALAGGQGFEIDLSGAVTLPEDVGWVWHDGIAYIFPSRQRLHAYGGAVRGCWSNISRNRRIERYPGYPGGVEEEVFKLWIDHGPAPHDGRYEYIVVPGLERSDIRAYMQGGAVDILANTRLLQAVRHNELDLVQAVFYAPGALDLGAGLQLKAHEPVLLMAEISGGTLKRLAIADPSRTLKSVALEVNARLAGIGDGWRADWNPETGLTSLVVSLPQNEHAGQSVPCVFEEPYHD